MKKTVLILILIALCLLPLGFSKTNVAYAQNTDDEEIINVDEMMGELDLSGISELYGNLNSQQKKIFDGDVISFIKNVASGKDALKTENFVGYALSMTGSTLLSLSPMIFSVIAVVLLINLVNGVRGSFASSQVENVMNFASVLLVFGIVFVQIFTVISKCAETVNGLKTQMEIVFPLLFTLMTALGASGSIAIYQPAVATLTVSITQVLTLVVLPLIIIITVFSVVGNLTGVIKLNGLVKFFSSLAKWIMYSSFFVFLTFLSLKGVTASVYDNMSVRTAKFALSKYVPVIGGYLSEGFNLVLAGTVLVKNAIGFTSIILLLVTVLPVLLEVILLMLALKLSSGVCETLGNDKIAGLLSSVSGAISLLISVLLGITFLYFVFTLLIIMSGNLVL